MLKSSGESRISRLAFGLGIAFGLLTAVLVGYDYLAGGVHSGSSLVFLADLIAALTLYAAVASLGVALVAAVVEYARYRGHFPWVVVGTSGILLLGIAIAFLTSL
jgi:hypothetical protein